MTSIERTPVFNLKKTDDEPRLLAQALDKLVEELMTMEGTSDEYTTLVANIKVLTEANAADKAAYKPNKVSAETLATIGANLAGILLVLNFERANVLTSKAFANISKLKI
jgi:hypothetical protein